MKLWNRTLIFCNFYAAHFIIQFDKRSNGKIHYLGEFVLSWHFGQTSVSTGMAAPHTLQVIISAMVFPPLNTTNSCARLSFPI